MTPARCERCGAPGPVPDLGATSLCEDCILNALAARFPLGDLSLEDLAAAVRRGPSERPGAPADPAPAEGSARRARGA